MARPTTGSINEHVGKDGRTYRYLRFTAYGKRRSVRLGPVTAEQAETALRHTLADVERGTWTAPDAIEPPPEPSTVPTFQEFADEWWTLRKAHLQPNTRLDYTWRLEVHLIPHFGDMRLDAITFDAIERYTAEKLAEGERIREAAAKGKPIMQEVEDKNGRVMKRPMRAISARSINMTVTLLGAILERAVKRKMIDGNPARDRDLRVPEHTPQRSYFDNAGQIVSLLDAAGELDRTAAKDRRHVERRAMLATLVYAGPRISELCDLRWRDVNLADGWLDIHGTKKDASDRRVKIRGALRDELLALRGRHQGAPQAGYVFTTRDGGRVSPNNVRGRVLSAAVKLANETREAEGLPPLPSRITPHSLRRTFSTVLYALGETPPDVMAEMGHTDPALALRVYAQAMRLSEKQRAQLRALVEGGATDTAAATERVAQDA